MKKKKTLSLRKRKKNFLVAFAQLREEIFDKFVELLMRWMGEWVSERERSLSSASRWRKVSFII